MIIHETENSKNASVLRLQGFAWNKKKGRYELVTKTPRLEVQKIIKQIPNAMVIEVRSRKA